MSRSLPYSVQDVAYDNAKFRQRSVFKVATQALLTSGSRRECTRWSTGKFLALLMICGLTYLMLVPKSPSHLSTRKGHENIHSAGSFNVSGAANKLKKLLRRAPRIPPDIGGSNPRHGKIAAISKWSVRQGKVKEAFVHAWSGYKSHAMGYDELRPLSKDGVDGLGGLGATVVDSLDTAMIMGLDNIVAEAGSWVETNLRKRISENGQVNLFETTIRVLGGLLSAYHLSGTQHDGSVRINREMKGPKQEVYLDIAKELADRLLLAFTFSPSPIPFSDVVLRDQSAHPAPDGLSSTAEVSTVQLEFNYLSNISGDIRYKTEAMKVIEHLRTLSKVDGLVPIYISPHTGKFSGENIRLGSRGDSYYEYLIKVWLQHASYRNNDFEYLHEMYEEAMKGVKHRLVRKSTPNNLVFVGELPSGSDGGFSPKMDHLVCFLPGTLALGATKGLTKKKAMEKNLLNFENLENLKFAEDLAKTCYEMYSVTSTGLAPEIAYFHMKGDIEEGHDGGNKSSEYLHDIIIKPLDRHNLLRPETVESLFVLHRITENPRYREWGWDIFKAFEKHTRVESGGYASLDDVTTVPPPKRNKMETFFLGETLKYLYLLFGDENVLPLDKFIFNTEAHPLPVLGIPQH